MNNFFGDLLVKYIDGKTWEIAQSFTYRLGAPDGPEFVHIGAGMLTDFASMPIVVRVIFRSPGGKWDKPAVVHDCLYKTSHVSVDDGSIRWIDRDEADAIFNEAMRVAGVNGLSRRIIYRGVRVGGWWAWRKHRKAQGHDVDLEKAG